MDSFWVLYWITRLDSIGILFLLLAYVSAVGVGVCAGGYINCGGGYYRKADEQGRKAWKRYGMLFAFLMLTFSTAKALTPSKEDAYVIIAGIGITEAVKSETAQRLASKSVAIIENWLDKQVKQEEKQK